MTKKITVAFLLLTALIAAAFGPNTNELQFIAGKFSLANIQLKKMLVLTSGRDTLFPRTTGSGDALTMTSKYDWTSGFFAGNLWYEYQGTGDEKIKKEAIKWTEKLESLQYFTEHHDLGFMLYCSYGNAYRLTGNGKYRKLLIQGARSLCTRFNPKTGSIKSWNMFNSWDGKTKYSYPVIIDNMLNLELLFFASKATGDPYFKNIAIQHANNVIRNQLRKDFSCYHVVCYDSVSGKILARETAQGYSNNSTWARGQSWGIYGFTMVYRETKDPKYLLTARKMADYFINNKTLPVDKIPYWDFNANDAGYVPGSNSHAVDYSVQYRDASAAAVTASALLELSTYLHADGQRYRDAGIAILHSLSTSAYLSRAGENGGFLLKHSVGSIPHGVEIDVPLIYADYYFLEALNRYKLLLANKNMINGSDFQIVKR